METIRSRLVVAALLFAAVFVAGTGGFYLIGGGEWPLLQCAYFVAITLSTVGYGEVLPVQDSPWAMAYTMFLMLTGVGVLLYFVSTFTAFVVEGDLKHMLWRRHMEKKINDLSGHVIVCGAGAVGRNICREFMAIGQPFVMVERDAESLERMTQELGNKLLSVHGDANSDETLMAAGVQRASGLVAALGSDQDNLFVTMAAKQFKPDIRVVSMVFEASSEGKLRRGGASSVVEVFNIGGLRMASEMVRPTVTDFLDHMLRNPDHPLRVDEIPVAEGSLLAGRRLAESAVGDASPFLVVAVRDRKGRYQFKPDGDHLIEVGSTIVVMGDPNQVRAVREQTG